MGTEASSGSELLRARFTAYAYRLPDLLIETKADMAAAQLELGGLNENAGKTRRLLKNEREELLKYIDSYQFSDLQVIKHTPIDDDNCKIAFACKLRSRGWKGKAKSEFLETNGGSTESPKLISFISLL